MGFPHSSASLMKSVDLIILRGVVKDGGEGKAVWLHYTTDGRGRVSRRHLSNVIKEKKRG